MIETNKKSIIFWEWFVGVVKNCMFVVYKSKGYDKIDESTLLFYVYDNCRILHFNN